MLTVVGCVRASCRIHLDLGLNGSTVLFYGFLSEVPIGFASFDEGESPDSIRLAGFMFGYRELEKLAYPRRAWLLVASFLCVAVAVERRFLGAISAHLE